MDRKKVYIGIIVFCFVATAGVLYWGLGGGTGTAVPEVPVITHSSSGSSAVDVATLPTSEKKVEYGAPAVFPQDATLDVSVFDSAKFKNLQDYAPLTIKPEEMGRDNPFAVIGH